MVIVPLLALQLAALAAPASIAADKVQFLDEIVGKGKESAAVGDLLTVTYQGWLQDSGKVFDESKSTEPPFVLKLDESQVIKGWVEGLKGAKSGGKRLLVIPSSFGYGDKGVEDTIPGKATIVFEVEILRIDKKDRKPMIEIEEIKAGTGEGAKDGDTVQAHYTGMFLNGVKFDSSHDRNEPLEVKLGTKRVIPGFEMGLTGMKVGEVRKVTIPHELAYGEKGAGGGVIPPFSTLIFELELVSIKP